MAKKRVYGEGNVTERKDGRFQVSVPGADGRRRYAYTDNPKDAEKLRRTLLSEVEQGKIPASKQPFQVHVREWLEMKKRGGGKPNTYLNAVYRMDAHFIPAFGHLPLNKLTPAHIQQLYNKLLDDDLSPNTIREYHQTLKVCLDSAVRQGKLNVNPCSKVELPQKRKSKHNHLSQEEALGLLEAVKRHQLFSVLVPLALASEARESELLALTWDDVDMEQGCIRINKTLTNVRDDTGEPHLFLQTVTPKSESGTREISLPDFALEALRKHRTAQVKQMMTTGRRNTKNLVFLTNNGGWYWTSNVGRMFDQFASKLGFDITFHDLRHTGATLLLEAGVPANVVQERLGHADVATTLRTYAHVTKRMADQTTGTLQTLFAGEKITDFEAI